MLRYGGRCGRPLDTADAQTVVRVTTPKIGTMIVID